jgi:hypothetical protein
VIPQAAFNCNHCCLSPALFIEPNRLTLNKLESESESESESDRFSCSWFLLAWIEKQTEEELACAQYHEIFAAQEAAIQEAERQGEWKNL